MKNFKFLKYTFTFVGLSLFGIFNYLFANSEYYYKNLIVNAAIQQDGTIQVNEVFDAYFNVYKHGIIRDIPLKYTIDGKKFRIFLENIEVDGRNFSSYETNGEKEIKIGDANRELIGEQRYSIRYSVYGLIRNFAGKGREELSWNIIPNGFDTHIDQVRIELKLPKVYTGFTSEDFLVAADGKSNKVEDFEGTIDRSQGDKIILTYDKTIPAGNGITLAMKFPVGYFTFDHKKQESLIDNENMHKIKEDMDLEMIVFFIGVGFLLYFAIAMLINQFKRRFYFKSLDKSLSDKFPIIIQYDTPKELLPPEVGFLANHGVATTKQISSLFYKRLNEKVIDIKFYAEQKVITLIKLRDIPVDTKHYYERWFLERFFTSTAKTISKDQNFYNVFKGAEDSLECCCRDNGLMKKVKGHRYYDDNINLIPNSGWNIVIGLFICGFLALLYPNNEWIVHITIGILPIYPYLGLAFLITKNTTHFTEKGMQYKNHILGYKQFLEKEDTPVLEKFLQQDPLYFDKIMPYAVALGLDTLLIKKFEPLLKKMNVTTPMVDNDIFSISEIINTFSSNSSKYPEGSSSSSYDRDSGFSSGSSFSSHSSSGRSGGGGGGGGGRSW